jgi:hypothetical protein
MTSTVDESEQVAALRARVEQLEREKLEIQERANAAIAAMQERVYWLDRWQIDLNEVMRRRSAQRARTAAKHARGVYRWLRRWRRRLLG